MEKQNMLRIAPTNMQSKATNGVNDCGWKYATGIKTFP